MTDIETRKTALEIKLTQGKFALVDAGDFEYISQWKWFFHKGYAVRRESRKLMVNGKRKTIYMHRLINRTPDGMETDHIDLNGLNNTKENLRSSSRSENLRNQGKQKNGKSSQYKGVSWNKNDQAYHSRIHVNKKRVFLGTFKANEEKLAALAYNEAAIKYHGEYACLNKF